MSRGAAPGDRRHFGAIPAAEAASEGERIARAVATPAGEHMLTGTELDAQLPLTPAVLAELDARADGQMEIARRGIALALRRNAGE